MYDSLCVRLAQSITFINIWYCQVGVELCRAQLVLVQHFASKNLIALHCVTLIFFVTQWGGCDAVCAFLFASPMLHCSTIS